MKKILLTIIAGAALCALVGCTHTTYTEATSADGSTVKHFVVAPGTKITTIAGGCIDSTGAAACLIN